jgi:hypothetical protein
MAIRLGRALLSQNLAKTRVCRIVETLPCRIRYYLVWFLTRQKLSNAVSSEIGLVFLHLHLKCRGIFFVSGLIVIENVFLCLV